MPSLMFFIYLNIERERIITNAINDAKMSAMEQEEYERLSSQMNGPLSSSDFLAKGFKKPSEAAIAQGKARLLMEDMVSRAEKGLLELKKEEEDEDNFEDEEEAFRKPGSLLKKSEVARIFAASSCTCSIRSCNHATVNKYRTIDGTCNNLGHQLWGAAHTAFRRLIPSNYEDGISELRGCKQSKSRSIKQGGTIIRSGPYDPPFPSARYISQHIVTNNSETERPLTHMVMQWGQFLDHDLDLGPELHARCPPECKKTKICQPIKVHKSDPAFSKCIPFRRTIAACTTTPSGHYSPREQLNDITSYIDGSQVYGSSAKTAKELRTFRNGLLKTSRGNNLPITTRDCMMGATRCYLAGDVRANEQAGLTAMHTLWVREHNRIAKRLKVLNNGWNDERLYQETRKIIGAMMQKITYQDYLPKLINRWLLKSLLPRYKGYNASLDASIPNVFATAAYRYGHSLVRPVFARYLSNKYEKGTNRPLNLLKSFFNINAFRETSLGAIFRGLATDNSQRMDESLNSVLTTQLFKKGKGPGLDLAALNIQRQRDHGLPSYTVWRNYCLRKFPKLPMATMRSHTLHRHLLQIYGYLENVDFWLGGISEKRLSRSVLGPTFACIFGLTFRNLRDGDRFWYEKPGVFTGRQLREIQRATLASVICDNTDINNIQRDVFLWRNRRVSCSKIPRMRLNRWKGRPQVAACYMKISHNGGRLPFISSDITRDSQHKVASMANQNGCLQTSCPFSSYVPEGKGLKPMSREGQKHCSIKYLNSKLPKNTIANSEQKNSQYYGWGFTSSLINGQSGIYGSLEECNSGRHYAIKYSCNTEVMDDNEAEEEGYGYGGYGSRYGHPARNHKKDDDAYNEEEDLEAEEWNEVEDEEEMNDEDDEGILPKSQQGPINDKSEAKENETEQKSFEDDEHEVDIYEDEDI